MEQSEKDETIWKRIVALKEAQRFPELGKELYEHFEDRLRRALGNKFKIKDEDLLTEVTHRSIAIAYRNIIDGVYAGRSSLMTYLFSIGKFVYFNIDRGNKRRQSHHEAYHQLKAEIEEETPERLLIEEEFRQIARQLLNAIGERCRELMRLYRNKAGFAAIAESMNYATAGAARVAAHNCRRRLKELMRDNKIL